MTVSIFEHLGITTWKDIYQRWMFIENVLKGQDLTKFRNAMLAFKELFRSENGYHWGLGKPEYMCSDYFWELFKTNGLGYNGEDTTAEDRCIELDRSIWFILGKLMQKKHHNVFGEHVYYVRNNIHKPFNMGTIEYTEHVREMF